MSIVKSARRPVVIGIAVLVAAAIVFVFVWFQPQKLVIDSEVNEALPGALPQPLDGGSRGAGSDQRSAISKNATPTPGMEIIGEGAFRALAHPASGHAKLLEVKGGDRYLRLEDFMVENGPDLRVYLSTAPSDSESAAFGNDFIDLGALKGNVGNQNYRIPTGADLDTVNSAVIWCRRFSVGFAVASITE